MHVKDLGLFQWARTPEETVIAAVLEYVARGDGMRQLGRRHGVNVSTMWDWKNRWGGWNGS